MENKTNEEWIKWCEDNEATDTVATVRGETITVSGTPKDGSRTSFNLVENK